jgi:hypothetical protein
MKYPEAVLPRSRLGKRVSGCLLIPPSPPSEKATARQDQARQSRTGYRTGNGRNLTIDRRNLEMIKALGAGLESPIPIVKAHRSRSELVILGAISSSLVSGTVLTRCRLSEYSDFITDSEPDPGAGG